jgi:5'-phosphate synthase pdxT subunit
MVFIRAPRIVRAGPGVTTLAAWRDEPVLAREGSVLVSAFHPELTDDLAVHCYFAAMAAARGVSEAMPAVPPGPTRADGPAGGR